LAYPTQLHENKRPTNKKWFHSTGEPSNACGFDLMLPIIIIKWCVAGAGILQQTATNPGTTFLSTGGTGPHGMQGFALVPASYLTQVGTLS